ncbi:MAG: phage tail spike protein [Thomasclavelia ramosa]
MIPRIYDNSFTTYESNGLGLLVDAISCQVEEESNGDFELTLVYPSDGSFFYALKQDNLIKADASDSLKGQLFRIDTISKPLNGQVTVYAKHISFDLAKNSLNEDINERNINCENAGKHMLQKSDADSRFSIESNIEMLGNYSMDRKTDCLSAIAGTRGSLIDTFGNGPKLLRDNFTISVLNRRGKDDNTLIAYKKNITGFTLEEDYSEIINVIKPYSTYTEDEVEKTLYIDEIGVKSPRYVEGDIVKSQWIDFSDKFDEDETPTKEKLKNLAEKYFNDNNCDLPKMTYKIEFQPLSQTEEYKEDGLAELEYIGMDDSVYIANSKYGIRDQARVIKTTYNVLAEKYISIELGDPKTTLGSIINKSNNDTVTKDDVKDIVNKTNKKDYPNTLPAIPVVNIDRAGFKTISLSWEYENKPYYTYEIYASQEQGFTPNAFDLIFKGKASAFLHEVECSQTWYYKVRAVNTYGNATDFSEEVSATTTKISDAAEYFQEAAIESALIGSLNADVINAGKLKGTFIDARNLSVTDGNGNVTFSVGSDAIVRMIQGLIDISDEGIRINLEDSENNIVGYVVYDGQGVQIFTNDDEPISSFHREGSYAEKFVTDRLICPAVVQVADSNGCPLDWYIGNTATGDRTGRDQNNKADSLSTVLRNIKNYGTKFDAKLTIHVEDGCVINEKGLVIQDMMGTVFRLELGANVVINCEYFNIEDLSSRIFIEYVSDKRLVGGEITQADYNKYPIINSTSDDSVISVRHVDYIEIRGIRFEGVEGATGIKGLAGTNLVVDDCDFFGVDQCLKADGSSNVSLGWCSGNVDKLASIYNGSILTTSRRIPKYSNEEMVYVAENAIFIKSQYSYVQYDTLHSSSGSSSGGSGTNLNDVFSIPTSNLYTMVEGTGKVTSARKGYTGQGKYKTLKAHRGYIKLPITSIQSVMANKKSYTLKLKLTRLKTEHGYDSKTPHPIFRATGGSAGATDYWDSNVKFARGETQTLTLPTSIVQAIEKGADTLELWASSNQEQQYAFFGDVVLTIEGENTSQGDTDKPGTDVGSGETAYSAVGTTTANLNVRKGAGSSYAIITTLAQGTKVNIVAKDNATGWYKITYNGAYGYVSNKYITIESTGGGTTPDKNTIYDFPYADEMVEVGMTYWRVCDQEYTSGQSWSQGFTYRSANTPLSGTCVADQDVSGSLWETVTRSNQTRHYKAIDCSTFAGMMTKGLTYENSPYANKTNFTNFRKNILQKSNKTWAFNMVNADGSWAREAAAQAQYFDRVGLGIVYYKNIDTGKTYGSKGSASDNFSPIKKGDLIFYAKKDSSGNWKQPNRYMKVSHVAVCYGDNSSGKKSVIESTNGTMTKNHTFDDGTTINAGIRIVSIAGNSGYADDIVMIVRPQPTHYDGTLPGGGTESGGTGGGTTGDGVTDAGTTEYTNCVSEQGTIDGNKYVYKLKTCKITAYGGDSGSACNIPLNLGKTCGSFNLPFGTKIYIPSLKGKSITDGNGKTVICDGIFTVNDTGVGGTDFDLYMSTKSDTNAESVFGNTRREDVYILSYGSGYGYAWSYTQSYKWAYNNGTLSAYKVAFKDYIKYGGTLINFLKFKNDDANIRSSTYWSILNS